MVPMLTREQIEEWREWFMDPAPWPSEQQRVAAINALCDMALSSLPSGVTKTVPVEPTPEMLMNAQRHSEIGAHIAANWAGAYDCFIEFYKAMLAAAPEAAPRQNADQPKAAPQAPCTPRRSSPGLAERPDSPNGVSLERAAILDETDSGVKPAGVAPRVGEDEVIEKLHALIDLLAHRFKGYLPWPSELRDAVVRGHESFIAATIRKADELRALKGDAALKSKEGGAG
jgi:hypothetical protein